MEKMNVGWFGDEFEANEYANKRLINAAKALGCVTEDEISFGVSCLKRIATVECRYMFDDYGGLESKYYVLSLKDY